MTEEARHDSRSAIIRAGAALLETRPYETVTLTMVAQAAGVSTAATEREFSSMHALGSAILTLEGESMREAQRRAEQETRTPSERLQRAFRIVGENLASSTIVRAGVRIAGESPHSFPERNINPFRTWLGFITKILEESQSESLLRENVDIADAAWLLTAAGMGTKDLLAFTGEWDTAPDRLESTAVLVVSAISRPSSIHSEGDELH